MAYEITKGGGGYVLNKSLRKCYIGLGWDIDGHKFDLDLVALIVNNHGKLIPEPHGVVFYNNPTYFLEFSYSKIQYQFLLSINAKKTPKKNTF